MSFDESRLHAALRSTFAALPAYRRERLTGDASTRTYHRLTFDDGSPSLIVMDLPEDFLGSDEGASGEKPRELPFLEVQQLFAARNLPVPRVEAVDLASRILLLEDLGDRTFESIVVGADEASRERHYERAVDLMVRMHEALYPPPEGSVVARRLFDRALLRWELDHFREWGVEALTGPLAPARRAELERHFDRYVEVLASAPLGFVHRDFQSRNLMVRGDGSLVIIDFQDAMLGPLVYDLVALLCDSYVSLDVPLRRRLIARYAAARRLDAGALEALFDVQTVQRKLKDAGRFVYIDRVRANPRFLMHFPSSLARVGEALDALGGGEGFGDLLRELVPGFPFECEVPASIHVPRGDPLGTVSAEDGGTKTTG
jgi:N-acetylmuramate 1-kinase